MRRKTIKLSAAVVLSAGILLSLAAGITYATETEPEPYGDHQELQIPVYEDSTDVWADCVEPIDLDESKEAAKNSEVAAYVEPANLDEFKEAVKNPETAAISVNAETITSAVSVKRPVHLDVLGYDELSSSKQKDVKIKLDLSEKVGGFMVIRGLPREKVEIIDQGTTVLYWEQQSNVPLEEEPVSSAANAETEAAASSEAAE
ncbi:hypothetical protein [Anaeromassilibacillus senegalensis]|uniref:hypothetical protein n=1 Tax=Anaeromassilibacillus senegalensis TaxID=1673717 RepID=UPI00067FB390|nr:hypothetical protein [Anaeromassilibacillus senegalensis]